MTHVQLPEEALLRVERELGQRVVVAGLFQICAWLFLVWVLPPSESAAEVQHVTGAVIVGSMLGRVLLYALQRRYYPARLSRRTWRIAFRSLLFVGGMAWGAHCACALSAYGLTYPFVVSLIVNIGVAGLSVQSIGLDLVLLRWFIPIIMGPVILAAAANAGEPGYVTLAALLSLFVGYQLFIARRSHLLLVEAFANRRLVQEQKDQLTALVEAMPGYVLWTDLRANVLGTNRRFGAAFGERVPAEFVGAVRGFIDSGREQAASEHVVSSPQGPRWHLFELRRYTAADGERVVLSALDIEASKEAERQLEAARAIGAMASGIAHEINNPLQALRNLNALLRRRLEAGGAVEPATATLLAKTDKVVDRMANIVAALRTFARDGQGAPAEEVDVRELLSEVLELVRTSRAGDDVHSVTIDAPPGLRLTCRRTEIAQVLVNLLGNAYDAVKPLPERWIRLEAADLGHEVEFRVTDSGRGIPPDLVERIMQPFFSTKVGEGTGLGLSISRSIVERHRGSLQVDLTSPHTRFVVRLPRAGTAEAPHSEALSA